MKQTIYILALATLLGGVGGARQAKAEPITYTEQATATGTLGANPFSNALVTVAFTGDTTNVTGGSGFYTNEVWTATVTVAGIGTATFTDSMYAFVNQASPAAGIADNTVGGGSVLDTYNPAFASYNLMTTMGPLSGLSYIRPDLTFNTTLGGFNLSNAGNSTFTATTAVPEPSSLVVLGMATFAGAGYCRWRRRK